MRVFDGALDLLVGGYAVGGRRAKSVYGGYAQEHEDDEQLEAARGEAHGQRLAEQGALDGHGGRVSCRKDRQWTGGGRAVIATCGRARNS
jgi:hypothetical protein